MNTPGSTVLSVNRPSSCWYIPFEHYSPMGSSPCTHVRQNVSCSDAFVVVLHRRIHCNCSPYCYDSILMANRNRIECYYVPHHPKCYRSNRYWIVPHCHLRSYCSFWLNVPMSFSVALCPRFLAFASNWQTNYKSGKWMKLKSENF